MGNRFLNTYEQVTYDKLRAVTDQVGAHVFCKVRLADVIPVNNSGISDRKFRFALQSHVDFLVTDSDQDPQFCVEYDGPTHRQPKQIERDQLKDELLVQFGMPFIRINARYLDDRYRGLSLLTYFVDVWFLAAAFDEAQAAGGIAYDEPFDPTFVYSNGSPNGKTWPYWLSVDLQLRVRKLYDAGRIAQIAPNHWVGEDPKGNLRCISWLFIDADSCVFIETGMRGHDFPAVSCSDLLSQLAMYDLYDRLMNVLRCEERPRVAAEFIQRLDFYQNEYDMRCSASCSVRKGE